MNHFLKTTLAISIFACVYLGIIGLFQFDLLRYIFKMNEVLVHGCYVVFAFCGISSLLLYKKE